MIDIERLSLSYPGREGPVWALRDIDLKVSAGEVFGIIGHSGAGKSTLIRLINGLERPSAGTVTTDGEDVGALDAAGLRALRRRVGMIFQHFNLLSSKTVAQNVAYPLKVAGVPQAQVGPKVAELLARVGLSDHAAKYPAQLSGGQKQRVGIARALAARPEVLFCDEATSALDPATTEQILDLLKLINQTTGVTVVLITHESEVVRRICDSAALMADGRIVEEGPLLDLLANPESQLADILLPTGDPSLDPDHSSVVLTFSGQHTAEPVISGLTRHFGLDVSILGGSVDRIAGQKVGRLRVSLAHPEGYYDRAAVQRYLVDRKVSGQL